MRPTRKTHALIATASIALGLSATAGPAVAAPNDQLPEQVVLPATQGYFSWNRFPAQPAWTASAATGLVGATLWPDATIRGFDTIQSPSGPAGPGRNLTLDVVGGVATDPTTDVTVPAGSLYGQTHVISGDGSWDATLAGYQGSNWLFTHSDAEAGNPSVQRRDEDWAVIRRSSGKAVIGTSQALLATKDGVRAVWTGAAGKSRYRVIVRNGSFKAVGQSARIKESATLPVVTQSGRLVVLSKGKAQLVSKGGTFTSVDKRSGKRLADAAFYGATSVTTRGDTVVAFRTGESISSTGVPTFARVGTKGAVSRTTSLLELGAPLPAICHGTGAFAPQVTRMVASAAGTPIVGVVCRDESGAYTSVIFELDNTLKFSQLIALRNQRTLTPVATGADGRLVVSVSNNNDNHDSTTGWGFSSFGLPDAVPAIPGKVSNLRIAGQGLAKVRLTCKRDAGLLCTGIVTLRSGGKVVGWAPYALTGRGSWTASTFDRTIKLLGASSTATRLPAGTTATLSGLPASIDRSAPVPPIV